MPIDRISIPTDDGTCPACFVTPKNRGPWPAVILYGDAGGMRPAMLDMAQRLAGAGYAVLLPDLYYRHGPYTPLVPLEVFQGDPMAVLGPLMATTGTDKAAQDTRSFLAWLDARADVEGDRIGAIGFCMGGGLAIASAATYPERFAAVASFHGGRLATDAPASPHWRAPMLKAEVYIAAATDDDSYPSAMAERFEQALDDAGVAYRAEIYAAPHGWMVPDFPVHDPDAAERGWIAACALFERTLRG